MSPEAVEVQQAGTLNDVEFAGSPPWWVFLSVPLVIAAFAWASRRRARGLASLGNPALVQRIVSSVSEGNRVLRAVLVTLAVALICVGLVRPQHGGEAKLVPASGLDLVLVVDYSKSMLARDVYPSRIERLEAELNHFLDDAAERGDRVGVVVFAGRARGFPLTRDTRIHKLFLERADPRRENPGGTAVGKGLALALTFLIDARRTESETPPETKDGEPPPIPPAEADQAIILLTDGEDTASRPLEVADEAARLGVRIYTVGIGSPSGEPIQSFNEQGEPEGFVTDDEGNYLMTRLDEELLQELAKKTEGRYIKVESDRFGLDEVRAMVEDLSRTQRNDEIEIDREESYPFAIVPAFVLLCIALGLGDRRRV